jgi:hypothetical protein
MPAPTASSLRGRRLKSLDRAGQQEFKRLAHQLLKGGMTEDELAEKLGYSSVAGLRTAVDSGRATTERLSSLRQTADDHLPHLIAQKNADLAKAAEARTEEMMRRLEAKMAGAKEGLVPPPAPKEPVQGRRSHFGRKMGAKLTQRQHLAFRKDIDKLRQADAGMKTWSNLGYALGLRSGTAAKLAYDNGSTERCQKNLRSYIQLYATHGDSVLAALRNGLEIERASAHFKKIPAQPPTVQAPPASPGVAPAPEPASASEPPKLEFAHLATFADSLETEIQNLWRMASFFERAAGEAKLPRHIRLMAQQAQAQIHRTIGLWVPDVEAASLQGGSQDA